MNENELHQLLRKHPAKTQLPSAFEREVWSRIATDEERSAASLLAELVRRMLIHLGRPAVAFATIAIFGAAGAGTGMVMLKEADTAGDVPAYQETVNPFARAHAAMDP
jgi:hypothetical protein